MMAAAGLVHAKADGAAFQERRYAPMGSRSAFFEGKFVSPRDCLPRMPKNPST